MRKHRVDSIEAVVKVGQVNGAEGNNYAVCIKRVVPMEGVKTPFMSVDVYNSFEDGTYDADEDRVIKIRCVDTLELQFLLEDIKNKVAALTGVHVNF